LNIPNNKETITVDGRSETEGARRASGVSDERPNPEVTHRPKRRHYTEGYKKKVVEEVSQLRSSGNGQIGDYLRKEGIYYSMVRKWEKKFSLDSQNKNKSGRKEKSRAELEEEIKRLKKELKRAEKKLAKSELLIEIQKKISKMIQLSKKD
jgi:transposase-like protein